MKTVEEIAGTLAIRQTQRQLLHAGMQAVKDLYNADMAVPLPELDQNEQAAVANLLKAGVDGTAQRMNSTLPDIYYPPAKPGQTRSEDKANTARRANLGWWQANNMQDGILARRCRHLVGYGISPVVLRPDAQMRHARWEVRDPITCYPSPTLFDTVTPDNVIFTYTRSVAWLKTTYPTAAMGLFLNDRDPMITCAEYLDGSETVLLALGQARDPNGDYGKYGAPHVELLRAPNLTGLCPAVIPSRVTLDKNAGQFDGLIPMYYKQAKLDALEYIAITRGIFANQWLVARQGESPQVVVEADGRKGVIGVVKGGVIQEESLNPGYKTTQAIDRLAGEQRLEGNVPAEMQGVSAENIRTGRRGDQVLSNGIDFGIQEHQRLLETSLREENRRAIAIAKTYFGTEKHSYYVQWRGATGPVEYVPNEVFTADTNIVKYALAGSDLNSQVIRTGQKLGAGLISKTTARRSDPEIADPEFEDHQISAEMALTAFEQGVAQQMATGQIPAPDAALYVKYISKDKMSPIEAMEKIQKQAQERQATSAPAGEPAGPVAPGSPEAQPGIAPGSEAGTAIAPPLSAQANLHQILGNVGQARQAIRSGG